MGGGLTKQQTSVPSSLKKSQLDDIYRTKVFIDKKIIKNKLFSNSNQWIERRVFHKGDFIRVCDVGSREVTVELDLKHDVHIEQHRVHDQIELTLRQDDFTIVIGLNDELSVELFIDTLGKCVIEVKSMVLEGANNGMQALMEILDHVPLLSAETEQEILQQTSSLEPGKVKLAVPPKTPLMKIVILVVGTRGDVSPFVNLGLALKGLGHDVRIGTHAEYRDVVTKEGLKYYPLAGDPRKLSEYMVKTGGRLIPDLTSAEERAAIPEKMQMLQEITYSTWPACTQPDPEDETAEPFVAEAIISNPVSYGHIHCAEALCIPLHIMFPQPWHSTKCFPHPLSNMSLDNRWSMKNKMSYHIVDEFMWMGLGSMINDFRTDILKLQPFRIGEGGESVIEHNEVPISHMWSPSFVPRCSDWPLHVDVVGDFTRQKKIEECDQSVPFEADPKLSAFLEKCGDSPPIFIGFGSMVIADPSALVEMVKQSALNTGCGIIFQSGWTKYAEDYEMLNEHVMVVGSMSHDWLFSKVSGVVHHGGAGTTSAGLRAGCSTFICPFFGDQHFWAEMVNRAGAGPPGCPIKHLTTEKLTSAITFLKDENTLKNVKILSEKMNSENGVKAGVKSFEKNLPIIDMLCEVSLFAKKSKIAKVYCDTCGLKMSKEVDAYVHRASSENKNHARMNYRCCKWGVNPPSSVLSGIGQGLGSLAYELAGGVRDFVSSSTEGDLKGGMRSLVARPGIGGGILVEKVKTAFTKDEEETSRKRTHSICDLSTINQRGRTTYDFDPVQLDVMAQESTGSGDEKDRIVENGDGNVDVNDMVEAEYKEIEECFNAAIRFKEWCDKLDTDGDRHIEVEELSTIMGEDDALDFIKASDINQDGELNFAEMALSFISR